MPRQNFYNIPDRPILRNVSTSVLVIAAFFYAYYLLLVLAELLDHPRETFSAITCGVLIVLAAAGLANALAAAGIRTRWDRFHKTRWMFFTLLALVLNTILLPGAALLQVIAITANPLAMLPFPPVSCSGGVFAVAAIPLLVYVLVAAARDANNSY